MDAVKATGRKKLIMCALWTEACLLFPALDALNEGYEVYLVLIALSWRERAPPTSRHFNLKTSKPVMKIAANIAGVLLGFIFNVVAWNFFPSLLFHA